MHIGNYPHQK